VTYGPIAHDVITFPFAPGEMPSIPHLSSSLRLSSAMSRTTSFTPQEVALKITLASISSGDPKKFLKVTSSPGDNLGYFLSLSR